MSATIAIPMIKARKIPITSAAISPSPLKKTKIRLKTSKKKE
jgi:hypothetical protein